jgi:exodeoxyribonuclease VII large subunit
MQKNLLEKLKSWQAERARRDNVEAYRVLPYSVLEEIARREPQSAQELLEIKGIKEKKLSRYGKEILAIVNENSDEEIIADIEKEDKVFEVGEYLDLINNEIINLYARVRGEVSSLKFWPSGVSFDLKDKKDESLLKCFIWHNDYNVSGVELKDGIEVMISGYPEIRKQWGQLNFQTKLIELFGEGVLKKAYEELKRKLDSEGLFALERKKLIPRFVRKIGLITSSRGEAIIDFRSNLGNYGFKIKFYDVRVEGKQAIFELIEAMKWFNKNLPELDVIAIVKGGGSLESFQAFNTESFVREIATSKIPVICGVGHERDVTLAALAADKMVSTPTGAAVELTRSWDEATSKVDEVEHQLLSRLARIFDRFEKVKHSLHREAEKIGQAIYYGKDKLRVSLKNIYSAFFRSILNIKEQINVAENQIKLNNPERQLKLGYSLVSLKGKIVRSIKNVKVGEEVDIKVSDGELKSEVKKIYNL